MSVAVAAGVMTGCGSANGSTGAGGQDSGVAACKTAITAVQGDTANYAGNGVGTVKWFDGLRAGFASSKFSDLRTDGATFTQAASAAVTEYGPTLISQDTWYINQYPDEAVNPISDAYQDLVPACQAHGFTF